MNMRNYPIFNKAFALLAIVGFAACGGNNDTPPPPPNYGNLDPYFQQLALQCGVNDPNIGNMPYKQTVRGYDAGGELRLFVYGTGNGQVGAIGSITIPDLSRLGAGLNGSFSGCLSSQGVTGVMQVDGTMAEIRLNLVGPNVSLTPSGPRTPTIENQYIKGQFLLTINGRSVPMHFTASQY
jgi:hypothetical protein